ncbi:hypothetical protein COLO4_33329 [Corchorus olitorius]|uniref:Uncharacterized protein n=1 Tax=Corchorus olitorius TaxID=93759 RepID=A0A1R3GUT9_9ROSI|nr:hypothetical protein COLO4_33329 [Corchorus olitorius]
MAAKVALSSSLSTHIPPVLPKSSSPPPSAFPSALTSQKTRLHSFKIHAKSGEGEGELKPKGKKKFITKEEEPEQ